MKCKCGNPVQRNNARWCAYCSNVNKLCNIISCQYLNFGSSRFCKHHHDKYASGKCSSEQMYDIWGN